MIKSEYKHSDITSKIIGAAIKVHSTFNMGFPESVYKNALIIELKKDTSLKVEMEVEADVYYESQWVGTRRLDLLINNLVIVELKAVNEIEDR